ncbi:flagellar biosynthesis protein FlhF [Alkaliphilus oremlandii]|uniref:Flagellar biosynthesis protein FlhF n=1 Tax=Alkaliphilus oremlandii (strain OhILAs) TaxID=350688 RepID=A8MHF8_ALKOO|nr:flagellar biosynthesis protein FlhF [Alkaliphilus oremlandii]ABW19045.1 GTP-binding signal recognition particle SRP54 G- domain [Alkaliphilus oremlandii OhILAs]
MKVKKFYGVDNYDVISKVKNELGTDAVILHQRKVKQKGVLGIFKKPMIEVVAAIEDEVATTSFKSKNSATDSKENFNHLFSDTPTVNKKFTTTDTLNRINTTKSTELDGIQPVGSKTDSDLKKEIDDIKNLLGTVVHQMQHIHTQNSTDQVSNPYHSYLYNMMLENEMDEELIKEILSNGNFEEVNALEIENKETLREILLQLVPESINNKADFKSKVVFFVGSTGVGKTTTIAKIAANYSLEKGLKVGLISADTYRIAAVAQLKIYSDILNIPLEVIYSPEEIHGAIKRLENRDVILIDTAGRSHKNNEHVEELSKLLKEIHEKEVCLVVSATTKNSDLRDILHTYNFIDDYKIIFTKLDEVSTYGSILNIAMKNPQSISYVTTGQSVPDDIETITSNTILNMLLREI